MYGYGPQWGSMGGVWAGLGVFGMILWVVFLVAVVAGLVWLVRTVVGRGGVSLPVRRSPGVDVLEERYARGEIGREEYLQKKRDLA